MHGIGLAIGATLADKTISLVGSTRGQGAVVTSTGFGSNIFTVVPGWLRLVAARG